MSKPSGLKASGGSSSSPAPAKVSTQSVKNKLIVPKPSVCTEELLKKILETDDLSSIEDIEILFSSITDLNGGGLALCKSVRSLTLIDTALGDINPHTLAPISSTLERLNLSQQGLTRIAGVLNLPLLRELYLQENSITKIEGLSGCPRLQRVWLYGNKISRIDGLQPVGELRELWLQQNKISRIGGLEGLVHLETLNLSGNKISDYKDLQRLSLLPSLKSVSFEDVHFGCCPVTRLDGYRNFALCYLKQVKRLDGLEVTTNDRAAAEDAYMESILKFNNKVEEITREGGKEALAIEARRARTKSHGEQLKSEMVSAFNMLEKLVKEGLGNLHSEHSRQVRLVAERGGVFFFCGVMPTALILADPSSLLRFALISGAARLFPIQVRVRKQNQIGLSSRLHSIASDYSLEVSRQLEIERRREETEERAFSLVEGRTMAEGKQAIMISELQYKRGDGGDGKEMIACQHVGDHLPDFQLLADCFQKAQRGRGEGRGTKGRDDELAVMKCYRCYSHKAASAFVKRRSEQGGPGKCLTVYAACGVERGKALINGSLDEDLVLFSDPRLAVKLGSIMDEHEKRGVLSSYKLGTGVDEGEAAANEEDLSVMGKSLEGEEKKRGDAGIGLSDGGGGRDDVMVDPDVDVDVDSVSKSLLKIVGVADDKREDAECEPKVEFAAYFLIQCKITVGLFSTVTLEEAPDEKGLRGLLGQIPNSAQALKATYPCVSPSNSKGGEEEEEEDDEDERERGQLYCVRKNRLDHVLPEYHLLCAGSQLKAETKRVEGVLESLNSMSAFDIEGGDVAGGKEGENEEGDKLLRGLERRIEEECRRYQEALWEEVDPETADKLRAADKDIRGRGELVMKARESIELEREKQEIMLRDFRNSLGKSGGQQPSSYT